MGLDTNSPGNLQLASHGVERRNFPAAKQLPQNCKRDRSVCTAEERTMLPFSLLWYWFILMHDGNALCCCLLLQK
jgi:hypothetical protein